MSIARRLIASSGGGEVEPFKFQLTVSTGQTYGLPLFSVAGTQPNIIVDWGDSSESTVTDVNDANRFHTYTSGGTYTVSIIGSLPGFRVDNDTYKLLYSAISEWGNVGLRSLNFYGCVNITSIPSATNGLSRVTQWNNTFRGTSITSIPSGLFAFSTSAYEFVDTFSFTKITSIPSGLFNFSTSAYEFVDTFSFTKITSVPNNLFDNNTGVSSFASTFNACTSLISVPNELFRYNTTVINFSSTFRNNRALTNIPTFQYNQNVSIFLNVFNMSSTNNGSSNWGTVEALWSRNPEPLGVNAFNNCTGATNFSSIPINWK